MKTLESSVVTTCHVSQFVTTQIILYSARVQMLKYEFSILS